MIIQDSLGFGLNCLIKLVKRIECHYECLVGGWKLSVELSVCFLVPKLRLFGCDVYRCDFPIVVEYKVDFALAALVRDFFDFCFQAQIQQVLKVFPIVCRALGDTIGSETSIS